MEIINWSLVGPQKKNALGWGRGILSSSFFFKTMCSALKQS